MTAQNGILWWHFWRHGGALDGRRLEAADPGGRIWDALGPERAIGCVVYPSCEVVAPGVIRHLDGNRFMLGEPDGSRSARVVALADAFNAAGFKAPVRERIRDDVWFKLLGNATFNPVSVLTGGTLAGLAGDAGTRRVIGTMMEEARAVATALDISFAVGIEERMDMAAKVGAHRTSMLQDVEAGRPTELDALLGAVIELAQMTGIATPVLKLVYDLTRFRARAATAV